MTKLSRNLDTTEIVTTRTDYEGSLDVNDELNHIMKMFDMDGIRFHLVGQYSPHAERLTHTVTKDNNTTITKFGTLILWRRWFPHIHGVLVQRNFGFRYQQHSIKAQGMTIVKDDDMKPTRTVDPI